MRMELKFKIRNPKAAEVTKEEFCAFVADETIKEMISALETENIYAVKDIDTLSGEITVVSTTKRNYVIKHDYCSDGPCYWVVSFWANGERKFAIASTYKVFVL